MVAKKHNILHNRIMVVVVFLFVGFVVIVLRLAQLQIVSARTYQTLAENQHTDEGVIPAVRGEIKVTDKFSNEGYTVATVITKQVAFAVPPDIKDPAAVAKSLAPILSLDEKDLLDKISDKTKRYVPIKRQLTPDEEDAVRGLHLIGIGMDPESFRFYPNQTFLSHVLGFVGYKGDVREGLYGLERYFENDLKGKPGFILQEKDVKGVWIFGAKRDLEPAINGDNLILTIDRTLQFKAETVISEAVTKNGADSGSVIIMDPKTGSIVAMANYPNFDPNQYNKVKDPALFTNLATMGNYEPGSVFKPITMAASIDEGKIGPETTYNDTGQVVIDGYTIKNSDFKAHGIQTMNQALEQSLNTGAIYAKEQIGNAEFLKYVKSFGFGKPTGIELPEGKGNLSNLLTGNISVNYDTASFGQGLSVTPIQLVQAFSAFANNGVMMKPYIVQSKILPDGKVMETKPTSLGQIIQPKTATTVSAMMVNVVENGHGKRAGVKGYYVAGKTGTAQVPRKDGKGYEANNNIGSFIGYAPVENPKFVMLVRVNHPRDVSFAESTAAPAFGQLAQFILDYYNIPPTRTDAVKNK
jgi:cell division protein FtsI/penicillin-binding protein 2